MDGLTRNKDYTWKCDTQRHFDVYSNDEGSQTYTVAGKGWNFTELRHQNCVIDAPYMPPSESVTMKDAATGNVYGKIAKLKLKLNLQMTTPLGTSYKNLEINKNFSIND